MRRSILFLVVALLAVLIAGGKGTAQSKGKGKKGGAAGPSLEKTIADLKLSGTNKETVDAAVKSYREMVRKETRQARTDLLSKMKEVLSKEEFTKFEVAAARDRGPAPARGGRGGRGLKADQMVERLMAFDKNKDGKITKDELPERMHHLIAKGDTNRDGALDKDEIKKLAETQSSRGSGGRRGAARLEQTVEDLKLSGTNKETADAAVKSYRATVRKQTRTAGADLLSKMKEVLSADEVKKVATALDRLSGSGRRPGGGRRGATN